MVVGGLVAKSCTTLVTPCTVAHQAPLCMRFSRQEYWSGLPFPSPGDLSNPGIESVAPASPVLQADSSARSHRRSPILALRFVESVDVEPTYMEG